MCSFKARKEFFLRVKFLLLKNDINQRQLADKIGVTPNTISRYLRLDHAIPLETFMDIMKVVNATDEEIHYCLQALK